MFYFLIDILWRSESFFIWNKLLLFYVTANILKFLFQFSIAFETILLSTHKATKVVALVSLGSLIFSLLINLLSLTIFENIRCMNLLFRFDSKCKPYLIMNQVEMD